MLILVIKLLLRIALRRWYKRIRSIPLKVEYRQGKDFLIYKNTTNGFIPADRDGWVYLPFLANCSSEFQPLQEGGKKVYVAPFKEGEELKVVDKEGTVVKKVKVSVDNAFASVEVNGALLMKGPIVQQ